jgi:hypothetical protein
MSIPLAGQNRIAELCQRGESYISPVVIRDLLLAKAKTGMRITPSAWLNLADIFSAMEDRYYRNAYLSALAQAVETSDKKTADIIYAKLDESYFSCLNAKEGKECEGEECCYGDYDPQMQLEMELICANRSGCVCKTRPILDIISRVENPVVRANLAYRAIEKTSALPPDIFAESLKSIAPVGALNEAQAIAIYLEREGLPQEFVDRQIARLLELAETIAEDYPREAVIARVAVLIAERDMEKSWELLNKLESASVREFALEEIAEEHITAPDTIFNKLFVLISDASVKADLKLKRLERVHLSVKETQELLEEAEGELANVKIFAPRLGLICAWAKIDPLTAEEKFNLLEDLEQKVSALKELSEIWQNSDPQRARRLLEDNYAKIARDPQLEILDKAKLLREIALAYKIFDNKQAQEMLNHALTPIL